MLLLAYRAYASQLQERRRVDFLLAFHRRLHESGSPTLGLEAALSLARETLRAQRLEIVPTGTPGAESRHDMALRELAALGRDGARLLFGRGRRKEDAEIADLLAPLGVNQAMIVPLRGPAGERGVLAALGHVASVARFGPADLAVLDALAEQLSLALERDSLADSLDALRTLQHQLVHSATHDALTGLPNRRHLLERLDAILAERDRTRAAPAVLFIDLDGFKGVNDRLGHAAGDELLIVVAQRLLSLLGPDDLAARLGGDEFVAVLADTRDEHRATQFAEQAWRELTAPVTIAGRAVPIGASIGLARATSDVLNAEELLERADEVMYDVKGRAGGVQLYDAVAHGKRTQRRSLQDDLAQALQGDGLDIAFQPVVALASAELAGVEALARWRHPRHGDVDPEVFIALAESTGQITALGQHMMRSACRQLATWQHAYPQRALSMSVNVSARELQHDSYAAMLAEILDATGADPRRLVIEVTESFTLGDERAVICQLEQLRALGLRVAVDDFGSGYASLHQLRVLPVDQLKIDRGLLGGAVASANERAMLRAVVELGAALRLELIAEGVETPDQRQLCQQLGIVLGQGWLFGRPMSAAAVEEVLRAHPADAPALAPEPAGTPLRRDGGQVLVSRSRMS
jgi:diguanylate cyclase (GGDEF)-like protein